MSEQIDTLNLDIITGLRQDGRITIKDLAAKLQRRRATIHNRIQKLEESNIIKGYTVIPDFKTIGHEITVFILIALSQGEFEKADSLETIGDNISKLPNITEVHSITGQFDYLIKARVKSLEDIGTEISYQLRKLYGIRETLTLAAIHTHKEELGNSNFNFFYDNISD